MLPTYKEDVAVSVPLTLKHHQAAEQFRQQQADGRRGKQIYLNTLAVQAVRAYLKCLGIETDLEASHSWDRTFQTLADTADLLVPARGRLECRPVLPDAKTCYVPAEVWNDRVGYIAVQFNADLTEAVLLGFLPQVDAEEVSLKQFQSLDKCLDFLTDPDGVQLSHWLQHRFEAGWAVVESLLDPQSTELTFSFRRAPDSDPSCAPDSDPDRIWGVKTIDLMRTGDALALFVGITPKSDGEMDLLVAVEPKVRDRTLPQDLQLLVLDETGAVAMQAQSLGAPTLKFKFSGETGERFSVRLALGDFAVTEQFRI